MNPEELKAALAELQKTLEATTDAKTKSVIEAELKKLNDESTKKAGETELKTASIQKELTDLKAANVIRDEADKKNQKALDDLIANGGAKNTGEKAPQTLSDAIGDTVKANTDDVEKFLRKETKNLVIEMKAVGDMSTGNVTSGTRYGQIFAPSIIQTPNRRVHVRDLVGISPAGPGNSFTYMKELTTGEGAIAPVAEAATKPQFDIDLAEATVQFETIAGWLRITNKALNNIMGMTAFLQSRLPEKLLRVEDAQLLYGDGVTPNIKGLGVAGNYTAATGGGTNMAEELIDAISQLEDGNERMATGILVRPSTYYNFFKKKASGSGEYDLPKNFVFTNGVLYIGGVPVYASTAVTVGDYFVSEWNMAAQILMQESMRIEFFREDGTNVRENKVTVRIEETLAFPVYGASFTIYGNDATNS